MRPAALSFDVRTTRAICVFIRAMSFAAPLFLLGLLAVPVGVALHLVAQRRRRRYAVRFPGAPVVG